MTFYTHVAARPLTAALGARGAMAQQGESRWLPQFPKKQMHDGWREILRFSNFATITNFLQKNFGFGETRE
jgi:hypothetical protein